MKIKFSKTLMSVFLGMSALVFASCGKAPQHVPTVDDYVEEFLITLDAGEEDYVSVNHPNFTLPAEQKVFNLVAKMKLKAEGMIVPIGVNPTFVGSVDPDKATLVGDILNVKDAIQLQFEIAFHFDATNEDVVRTIPGNFTLPAVQKVTIVESNYQTVTNYGVDFHTNGFGFKEMHSGGSYGVMSSYAQLERVNKVTIAFTQVGCLGSIQVYPSLDNTTFSGETGDIANQISVSEIEDNKLVFDFTTSEFVDRFVGGPYYLKMWAWANGPGEGDSIVGSVTVEYIPWTAPAE